MLKKYYHLTKPGIVYGNALTTVAAFLFASRWHFAAVLFLCTILGIALVIASASVFNNYIDRDIDTKMERTKNRGLVTGAVSAKAALVFASALGLAGLALLYIYVNMLTASIALAGFVVYVAAYTPLKRKTSSALFVGALAGAVPPVVGYTAVANTLDWTAFLFFACMFLWQLPHFLAIAVYRFDEYKAAGVPLFIHKNPSEKQKQLARKIFFATLLVLLACSVGVSVGPLLL